MTILEKISSVGFRAGSTMGALIGGGIPYLLMKKELNKATTDDERKNIKQKYLNRILIGGGTGTLAGGFTGGLAKKLKRGKFTKDKNFDKSFISANKMNKNMIMGLSAGSVLGTLPGLYDLKKSKTEEEKYKAKSKIRAGALVGGLMGSGYKVMKTLDKGLE